MKPLLLTLAFMIAPAMLASGAGVPLPQLKPCVAIDEANLTSVIRVVQLVAKSDRHHGKSDKKEIYDRLPGWRVP